MMVTPQVVSNFSGWQDNARARPIQTIVSRDDYHTYVNPFLEWSIIEDNREAIVGVGDGIDACMYLLTRDGSITQADVIGSPDLSPGGLSGFIRPIGYYAGGIDSVLDEYGGPYSYDYYADGSFRAGCNFEVKIETPLEDGVWYLYVVAHSKDGLWGPVS